MSCPAPSPLVAEPAAAAPGLPASADESSPPRACPRPDPLFHVVLLALCGGMLLLAAVLTIRDQTQVLVPLTGQALPELCWMRRFTGLDCPGCGLTRCFISLAHGDAAAAWSYNPGGILLFAIVAFQVPYRIAQLWSIRRRGRELSLGWLGGVPLAAFAILIFAQWLLRLAGVSF